MINRLFRKKTQQVNLDEHIVWGLWATRRLKMACKASAAELKVPISVFVDYILSTWLADNYDTVLGDKQKRDEFGDFLKKWNLSGGTDE
ncbi:MAG: hypothetical protein MUP08_07050 [Desulfobulbaceae bacterium]|jgi:hypothetical protein|nr:hypothetical protein [Desulfobulbaceae bacterium]